MSSMTAVSVVIPVLNGAATIGATLEGVLHQAHSARSLEVIVVDNGSCDATPAVVERYPVTLLTESKRGPSAARNRGLAAATGEIVAYLDADTLPTRRWLAAITTPFAEPGVVQVAGRVVSYQPTAPYGQYFARYHLDQGAQCARAADFPYADSSNMAVRRSAALAIGGWDESFLVAQDVDFSQRLLARFGAPICYQPEALVFLHHCATKEELQRQAFKYGQGRARLWQCYPHQARRGFRWGAGLAGQLVLASLWPLAARAAQWVGRASQADIQTAECHRLWQWHHWLGFASMAWRRTWRY